MRNPLCSLCLTVMLSAVGMSCGGGCDTFASRPAIDTDLQLVPVKLGVISDRDQWIRNFDIFVARVEGVRIGGSYVLLLIVPTRDKPMVPPPPGKYTFELSGYTSDDEKPVLIDGSSFSNGVAARILDFISGNIELKG